MIFNSDLEWLREFVQHRFQFAADPFDMMWTDDSGEPIEECDSFWSDPNIIDVKYGCSKIVLFCSYLDDYVLKIPFLGYYTHEGKSKDFVNAVGNPEDGNNWDYCSAEERIYKRACGAGLGDLFCGTRFLCEIDNYPIYVSEKSGCSVGEDETPHKSSPEGMEYIRSKRDDNFCYCPGDMSDNIIGMFYDSWGAEKTSDLLDFLLDNDVRDCHNDNVAFKDGKIRLIDYSSFYG